MQKKVTINNSNQSWNPKKRYKINEVVYYNGAEYQNATGINSEPGVGLNWISLDNSSPASVENSGTVRLTSYEENPKVYPQSEMDVLLNEKLNVADVPSNLNLYPTNVASDVSGYSKMVISLDDVDYNDTAVDISTAEITTTNQLVASLASAEGILKGNPGIINVTTIGNVKRLSGTGTAEFYFKIFKRTSAEVETLIATSNATMPISNSVYGEFQATAILNNGSFTETDRIVIKYYANRIAGNSNPVYQFQFGGITPVRTILPVPFGVIPVSFNTGVTSFNTRTGSVILSSLDVTGALGYTPYNASNPAGYVPSSRTITINGESYDLSANRTFTVATHDAVIIGTANGLSLSGQQLSLGLASSLVNGALSSTDWTTFNNKIGGSGTTNFLPKFTASGTIGNSQIFDNGTNVGIGTTNPSNFSSVSFASPILDINGSINIRGISANGIAALQFGGNTFRKGLIYSSIGTETPYLAFGVATSGSSSIGNEAMRIASSGNVGIGTTNPSTRLDVNGAITASGGFFNSDIRLKDLIDYDYNVLDIKPISYLWKDGRDEKKHVGYSAQDVQKVMPDAVNEGADGMLSVNYVEVLVAKIAELENRIKQFEK
jgi:predicted heme/steroid binding protein